MGYYKGEEGARKLVEWYSNRTGKNPAERFGIEGAEETIDWFAWFYAKRENQPNRRLLEMMIIRLLDDPEYVFGIGNDVLYAVVNDIEKSPENWPSEREDDNIYSSLTIANSKQEYKNLKKHFENGRIGKERTELLWDYTRTWRNSDLFAVIKSGLEMDFPPNKPK